MYYHADSMTKNSINKAWVKRVVYSIKLGSYCPFLLLAFRATTKITLRLLYINYFFLTGGRNFIYDVPIFAAMGAHQPSWTRPSRGF